MFSFTCVLLVFSILAFVGSLIATIFSIMDNEGALIAICIVAVLFFLVNTIFLGMFLDLSLTKEYSEMECKLAQQKYERMLEKYNEASK